MYYVGIDISKGFSVVAIKDENNKVVKKNYIIKHNQEGFNKFISILDNTDTNKLNFTLGMEATGAYFENIYEFLKSNGYNNTYLINPWQTDRFKEMYNLNFNKNDNIDSLIIASLLKSGMFKSGYVSDDLYQSIKQLNRLKIKFQDEINSYQKQIISLLDVVFPEFTNVIKNPFSVTGLTLLKKYPTSKHYKYANEKRLLKLFRGIKGNNFNKDKALLLLSLAKNSIFSGKAYEARGKVMIALITQLEFYNTQIETIKQELNDILNNSNNTFIDANINPNTNKTNNNLNTSDNTNNNNNSNVNNNLNDEIIFQQKVQNLHTINGISTATIATVLSEVGNIDRFDNVRKFLSYVGLVPTIKESGSSSKKPKLSKKANHYARKALYLAAVAAILHNKELKQIYQNKLNQGKSKKEAIIIVAKKLASIIYGIWKSNTPYSPSRVFISSANYK